MLDKTHRRPRRALKPERRGLTVQHLLGCRHIGLGQLRVLFAPRRAETQGLDNLAAVLLRSPRVLRDLVA
eukprot:14451428-Alexandrium_andersonii.AAC.1